MMKKQPLIHHRVRKINGGFAWISHQFLRRGFWGRLTHHEILLYFFLVMVGDRQGVSYYGYDKICSLTKVSMDEYILARNGLMEKDLVAFDGRLFQVLSLPETVPVPPPARMTKKKRGKKAPVPIGQLLQNSLDHMGVQK